MAWLRKAPGRIFINYRRDDTAGVAGRLSDTLNRYFGDGRVFRDVEGIQAGANFEEVLKNTTQSADAMIVLIGRDWVTVTDAQGQRRLHDPHDWVAREIAAALEKKIPVYPVLIENAQMPRAEELPEPLRPLVRHNAMSISDHRWASDTTRLAKVVAIDIPGSAAEQTLEWVRWVISLALFISVAGTTGIVCWKWFHGQGAQPLEPALLGITFIVVVGCSTLLLFFARLVDPARRRYVYASALAGLLGTFVFFVLYWWLCTEVDESAATLFGSTITATAMLVLMNLSGFKAR
jgi:hypothetical protein